MSNDSPKLGFELFESPVHRSQFEQLLHRVGYKLETPPLATQLVSEYDALVEPLGNGRAFTLRLRQGWDQAWNEVQLIDRDDEFVLGTIDFDRTKRYDRSCYKVWSEQIAELVRQAASSAK